mmetsp:Transcript_29632/g.65445  ORF Transcript_29632/g.65445 Transcript_29632/m.65445 type:complete len:215 (+) Transcript_29632:784-1428(+)
MNSCAASSSVWPLFGWITIVTENSTSELPAETVVELEVLERELTVEPELTVLLVLTVIAGVTGVLGVLGVLTVRPFEVLVVEPDVTVLALVAEVDDDVDDFDDGVDTVLEVDVDVALVVDELTKLVPELTVEAVDDEVEVCVLEVEEETDVDVEDEVVEVVFTITTGGEIVSTATTELTFSSAASSAKSLASTSGVSASSRFATFNVIICVTEL